MTILVLEAIAPWIEGLARGLSHHVPVTAMQHLDMRAQKKLGLPRFKQEGQLTYRSRVFPPGFAGKIAPSFTPFIRRGVTQAFSRMHTAGSIEPHVICPFPYAAPWVRHIPDDRLIYYNVDDYTLYDPARADRITALEDELVNRARLTICVAQYQAEALRKRHPDKAGRIHHIPHGLDENFLNPAPQQPPLAGVIGYVGNLTDRVDWRFVDKTVQLAPDLTFEFIGRAGDEDDEWANMRAQVFARANVHFLGPVPQAEVTTYYWRSAVNWMPYDVDHPFNIASSPTKIFDAFGSGRPFVATSIPEVKRYPDRIGIAATPQEAAEMLRANAFDHNATQAIEMREFATSHIWPRRVERLLNLIGR